MSVDIRDCDRIDHADVLALNFIRQDPPYIFRKHFRSGLRSRIIEVLDPAAVTLERRGVIVEGVPCFPRARPVKMLRIFRTRFAGLEQALEETRRLKIIERYLSPGLIAISNEFFVGYRCNRQYRILLCGLQDYVHGVALDPWQAGRRGYLEGLHRRLNSEIGEVLPRALFCRRLMGDLERFVTRIRSLMVDQGLVPDLAGARNLIVSGDGGLHLVDINNIQPVVFTDQIPLDDKGYPVMDKSIEALDHLARHLLKRDGLHRDAAFATFFRPARQARVSAAESRFRQAAP